MTSILAKAIMEYLNSVVEYIRSLFTFVDLYTGMDISELIGTILQG